MSEGASGVSPLSWIPWVALVVGVGLIGGALGPLGALGTQRSEVLVSAPSGALVETTPVYVCAGGATVGSLPAGERVVTVERSTDSSWLGVRNPDSLIGTIWLPAGVLTLDDGQDVATLPEGGECPVITASVEGPDVAGPATPTVPEPGAGSTPDGGPTPDASPPSISVGSFSPQPVFGTAAPPNCATQAMVTVTATDDVAISSVSGSADIGGATVQLSSSSGSSYVFAFSASYSTGPTTIVTVTFTATDAAGNQASAPRTLVLKSSGDCLI